MSEIDVDETVETAEPAKPAKRKYTRRHDVPTAGAKSQKRASAARHDSEVSEVAIDGYGDPLKPVMAKGWVGLFVTQRDANRYQSRRWSPARWGDAEVVAYPAAMVGKQGDHIQSPQGQLKLYKMRESDFNDMHRNDPNRQLHQHAARRVREQRELAASLNLGKV